MDEHKLQVLKEARAELLKISTKLARRKVQPEVIRVISLIDAVIKAIELEGIMDFHEKVPRYYDPRG